jgi:hypothetical protein
VNRVHFFADLVVAFLLTVGVRVVIALCGHRITWRLAALFSLIVAFHA